MNIVVTGGTGFIGHALVEELSRAGHDIVVLSRRPHSPTQSKVRYVEWDARSAGPWQDAVAPADAIVNLAGEPIAEGRWTSARKRILVADKAGHVVQLPKQFADAPDILKLGRRGQVAASLLK